MFYLHKLYSSQCLSLISFLPSIFFLLLFIALLQLNFVLISHGRCDVPPSQHQDKMLALLQGLWTGLKLRSTAKWDCSLCCVAATQRYPPIRQMNSWRSGSLVVWMATAIDVAEEHTAVIALTMYIIKSSNINCLCYSTIYSYIIWKNTGKKGKKNVSLGRKLNNGNDMDDYVRTTSKP